MSEKRKRQVLPDGEKRTRRVSAYLTPSEYEKLQYISDLIGHTPPQYVRTTVLHALMGLDDSEFGYRTGYQVGHYEGQQMEVSKRQTRMSIPHLRSCSCSLCDFIRDVLSADSESLWAG